MKIYLAIILIILASNSVSGYLLSDQGTDTEEIARGNPLASGNLTIEVYDHPTGGNLIFSQRFNNGIVDGSWNVMINPKLEYGRSYWKDYKINGEDLDFDGNERMEFQSPLGLINNVSFINLSLINYCPVGSSIRQVYENGSVECEANVTHSNSSTWWASLTGWVSGWFVNTDNQLDFNETKMNNSIDARASVYNDTAQINNLNATKLDASDQSFNETLRINAVNTTANIKTLGFNITTELNTLYLGIADQRYNDTALINSLNATKLNVTDQRYNETSRLRRIYNLNANVTTLSATVWNDTFNMSVNANTNYTYECNFFVSAPATATGVFINITAPATPTYFSGGYIHPTTITAPVYVYCGGAVRYCQSLSATSVVAGVPVKAWGRIINVNAGNIGVYTRSEVAAASTVMRGSYCFIEAE